MSINLNDYEDVASLNKWFQPNFPMGSLRILKQEHHIITNKDGIILDEIFVVQTGAFRDVNDLQPATMNVARGRQSEYPKHMARFFAEDVTTSSYGRCIALLKATDKTATKDSMEQVVRSKTDMEQIKVFKPIPKPIEIPDGKPLPNEPETVVWDEVEVKAVDEQVDFMQTLQESLNAEVIDMKCKHGAMISKRGTSKTGRAYYGYVCAASPKSEQCEPVWGKEMSGKWVFEDKAVHYGK